MQGMVTDCTMTSSGPPLLLMGDPPGNTVDKAAEDSSQKESQDTDINCDKGRDV